MVKLKMGYCTECGNTEPKPIIKNLCNYHYWKSKRKPIIRKPYKINTFSKKRQKENQEYEKQKALHFKEFPFCQFPGCTSEEKTLHHGKGRIGKLLIDRRYFKTLCPEHHRYCEEHPEEAKRLGLSFNRL